MPLAILIVAAGFLLLGAGFYFQSAIVGVVGVACLLLGLTIAIFTVANADRFRKKRRYFAIVHTSSGLRQVLQAADKELVEDVVRAIARALSYQK